ncbi:MAG: hypothetical protein ABH817_01190 [archaeon]
MVRKQISITIDKKTLDEFKEFCGKNDINISKRIERYMKKDLKN